LTLRLIFFVFIYDHPERAFDADSFGYVRLAESLLDTQTFPSIFRTPVYPFFIATIYSIFGKLPQAVLIFQYLLDSLTVIFVILIFLRISGNTRYSYSAGLIYAINPFAIFYSNMMLSEILFTFLCSIAIYFFILSLRSFKKRYFIVSAIFLALGTLCRPISLYLPLIIAPFTLLRKFPLRKKLLHLLLFIMVFFISIVPWFLRNYQNYGRWTLSTVSDINIFYYEAPAIQMVNDNPLLIFRVGDGFNKSFEIFQKNFCDKIKIKHNWNDKDPFSITNDFLKTDILRKEGLIVIKENFLRFLLVHFNGLARTLFPFYPNFEKLFGYDLKAIKIISFVIDVTIIGLFLFGIFSLLWDKSKIAPDRTIIVFMMIVIFYFSFLPGLAGYSRFRIPVLPYITILATFGLWRIVNVFNKRRDLARKHL
jgi:4-amino-4-deoxy-L-arabinose transferase-like glycosyltransferase